MSDIAEKMAEWRRTLLGTGPCPDLSQKTFTLTDAERDAVDAAILFMESRGVMGWAATLRGLLDRTK